MVRSIRRGRVAMRADQLDRGRPPLRRYASSPCSCAVAGWRPPRRAAGSAADPNPTRRCAASSAGRAAPSPPPSDRRPAACGTAAGSRRRRSRPRPRRESTAPGRCAPAPPARSTADRCRDRPPRPRRRKQLEPLLAPSRHQRHGTCVCVRYYSAYTTCADKSSGPRQAFAGNCTNRHPSNGGEEP